MLGSKNTKGTKLSTTASTSSRVGVNKAAAAKTSGGQGAALRRSGGSGSGSGKLPKIIILVVIIVVIAGGAWWYLNKDAAPTTGGDNAPALPARNTMPQSVEFAHKDIKITYKVEKPFTGSYLVLGYDSWELQDQRFSDGHISLLPLTVAEGLRTQYGDLHAAAKDNAGAQTIRENTLNMPYIYNNRLNPDVRPELRLLESEFSVDKFIVVNISGYMLSYEKGFVGDREMPAPTEQGGAPFHFVSFNVFKVINNNW